MPGPKRAHNVRWALPLDAQTLNLIESPLHIFHCVVK